MPNPHWTKIKWFNYPNTPKALLQIPIKLEGLAEMQYLQLDTGYPDSHLYGYQFSKLIDESDMRREANELYFSGSIGNHTFSDFKFDHKKGFGKSRADQGQEKIGILGTDFFRDKVLVIDFRNDCFLISNDLDIIDEMNYEFDFVPTVKNLANIIRLSVSLNGTIIDKVLYDTGSSQMDFEFKKKEDWEAFLQTNKSRDISKFSVSNICGSFDVLEVASEANLQIGDFQCENPIISYPDTDIFKDTGINGVIGNKPFFDKCIVLDFINFRLGISKG